MTTLERSADVLLEQRAVQSSHHERLEARAAAFAGQMRRAYLDVKEAASEHERRKAEISDLTDTSTRLDKELEITALRMQALGTAMTEQQRGHEALHANKKSAAEQWALIPTMVAQKFLKRQLLNERRDAISAFMSSCAALDRGVQAVEGVAAANAAAADLSLLGQLLTEKSARASEALLELEQRKLLLISSRDGLSATVTARAAQSALLALQMCEVTSRRSVAAEEKAILASLTADFLSLLQSTMEQHVQCRREQCQAKLVAVSTEKERLRLALDVRIAANAAFAATLSSRRVSAASADAAADQRLASSRVKLVEATAASKVGHEGQRTATAHASASINMMRSLVEAVGSADAALESLAASRRSLEDCRAVAATVRRQREMAAQCREDLVLLEAEMRERLEHDSDHTHTVLFGFCAAMGNFQSRLDDTRGYTEGEERRGRSSIRVAMQAEMATIRSSAPVVKRARQDDRQRAMPPPAARRVTATPATRPRTSNLAQPKSILRAHSSESDCSVFNEFGTGAPPVRLSTATLSSHNNSINASRNGGAASTRHSDRRPSLPTPSPLPRRPTLTVSTNIIPPAPSQVKLLGIKQAPRHTGKPVVPRKVALLPKDDLLNDDLFENIFGPF
jgi:hypothetical protein